MRFNINLASQKYEDVRRFYKLWSIAISSLAVLALVLIAFMLMNYSGAKKSNQHIKELQAKMDTLQKERAEAEAIANAPQNHDVTTQKNYWNKQIYRRQLSWTQLFNDLQKIMPARAFLTTVRPELTADNRLRLNLTIKGDTYSNGLELVQKMEKSQRFRGTQINSQAIEKEQRSATQLYKFEIVTYYNPAGAVNRIGTKEGM
jgi:hypothetical protein